MHVLPSTERNKNKATSHRRRRNMHATRPTSPPTASRTTRRRGEEKSKTHQGDKSKGEWVVRGVVWVQRLRRAEQPRRGGGWQGKSDPDRLSK